MCRSLLSNGDYSCFVNLTYMNDQIRSCPHTLLILMSFLIFTTYLMNQNKMLAYCSMLLLHLSSILSSNFCHTHRPCVSDSPFTCISNFLPPSLVSLGNASFDKLVPIYVNEWYQTKVMCDILHRPGE